jgi:GYF domain 2
MSEVWFYAEKGRQVGPLTLNELRQKLAKTPNAKEVLVWGDEFPDWKKAGEVPELRAQTVVPPPLPDGTTAKKPSHDLSTQEKHPPNEIKGISGWLLLPVLGTILTPFYVGYGMFQLIIAITNVSPNADQSVKLLLFLRFYFSRLC